MIRWSLTLLMLISIFVFWFYLFLITGYSGMGQKEMAVFYKIATLPVLAACPLILAIFSFGKIPKKWTITLFANVIFLPLVLYFFEIQPLLK